MKEIKRLASGVLREGRTPNPLGIDTIVINPSSPKGKKMAKKKKKTKKKSKGKSSSKKTMRTKNRATNPKKSYKKKASKKRRKNPEGQASLGGLTEREVMMFKTYKDIVPPALSGVFGYAFAGLLDFRGGLSNALAGYFSGVDKDGKKRKPDYDAKAKAKAGIDVGAALALWQFTNMDYLKAYRKPILIGAAIRAGQSLADAVLDPSPGTVQSEIREILRLPRVQTKSLTATSLPPSSALVYWDRKKRMYVDEAGNEVKVVNKAGTGYDAQGRVLFDAESRQLIQAPEGTNGMGTYEEWNLVLNGPDAGFQAGMGSAFEQWNEAGMGSAFETWREAPAQLSAPPKAELGSHYGEMYGADAGFEQAIGVGSAFEQWNETLAGNPYEAPY